MMVNLYDDVHETLSGRWVKEPRDDQVLSKQTLKVNEIFGPTVQGEGISIGRPAMFLRLFGCPLHCRFCDTAYTWRVNDSYDHYAQDVIYDPKHECHTMTFAKIYEQLTDSVFLNPSLLVITGGEPMVQDKLADFIRYINHRDSHHFSRIEIETSGFRNPDFIYQNNTSVQNIHFNVSPKLESSGNPFNLRHNPIALRRFVELDACFKFVCTNEEDLNEIQDMIFGYNIPRDRVYLMPECIDRDGHEQRLPEVIDAAIKMNVNVAPRLHIMAWGNKRGV